MQSAKDYFTEKHKTLVHDYQTPDRTYAEHCGIIASNLAQKLTQEGKSPYIAVVQGKVIDNVGNRKTLIPLPFEGRVKWGAHQVCCEGGIAYDPMLSQPVSLDIYCELAFLDDVDIQVMVSEADMKELYGR